MRSKFFETNPVKSRLYGSVDSVDNYCRKRAGEFMVTGLSMEKQKFWEWNGRKENSIM